MGHESRQGPTPKMLEIYYKSMFLFSGDLSQGILGPFNQRSQDDAGLIHELAHQWEHLRPWESRVLGNG